MNRAWQNYPDSFRQTEVKEIASWLQRGKSGCVVGLSGFGKSNLLQYLCSRQAIVNQLLPFSKALFLIPINLNDLATDEISVFFRSVLRAFVEQKHLFPKDIKDKAIEIFEEVRISQDPFVSQTGLRLLLSHIIDQGYRVAFVFDRFDDFCDIANEQILSSLRGFRDKYKRKLSFLMGMRQAAHYLANKERLGELYDILDSQYIWVGPLDEQDARLIMHQELGDLMNLALAQSMYELSGGVPSIVHNLCQWYVKHRPDASGEWNIDLILQDPNIAYRLKNIANGLSQAELIVLARSGSDEKLDLKDPAVQSLLDRGLFMRRRHESTVEYTEGLLFRNYLKITNLDIRGGIYYDSENNVIKQGGAVLEGLPPLVFKFLSYLASNPHVKLTKTQIIENVWQDGELRAGISDESLYQLAAHARRRIEPEAIKSNFIVTWRGRPEGGYRFFPEGRPSEISDV